MKSQTKLNWEIRVLLNEWLMQVHCVFPSASSLILPQVHTRFRLTSETLFLATNLIDCFLSTHLISPTKIQLVGMACMLITSNFEETISPAITNFIDVCEGTYTAADMLQAEQHILRALEWDLSYPSPINYLCHISKADRYDPQMRTVGKYLAEIVCIEHRLGAPLPCGSHGWCSGRRMPTPTLAHYVMYAESTLVPVTSHMLRYILQPVRHKSFYQLSFLRVD
jgi:G2/mitotic-specific cyclin 1/2